MGSTGNHSVRVAGVPANRRLQLTGVPLRPDPHEVIKAVIKKRIGKDVGSLVWYDRLRCLFELRNSVIHYYPEIQRCGHVPGQAPGFVCESTAFSQAATRR